MGSEWGRMGEANTLEFWMDILNTSEQHFSSR
jgi:hypothetical protein